MSGGAESSINKIFKAFVHNFALAFKGKFLKPHSGEKLERAMDVYARLGFPGAWGSMDAKANVKLV